MPFNGIDGRVYQKGGIVKKEEIIGRLAAGEYIGDILPLSDGQECWIYKQPFSPGDDVIYIPDTDLNEVVYIIEEGWDAQEEEARLKGVMYTGDEILALCGGNIRLAKNLYSGLDWCHPATALSDYPYCDMEDDEWIELCGSTPAQLWPDEKKGEEE